MRNQGCGKKTISKKTICKEAASEGLHESEENITEKKWRKGVPYFAVTESLAI